MKVAVIALLYPEPATDTDFLPAFSIVYLELWINCGGILYFSILITILYRYTIWAFSQAPSGMVTFPA